MNDSEWRSIWVYENTSSFIPTIKISFRSNILFYEHCFILHGFFFNLFCVQMLDVFFQFAVTL
jgi:hypothetical protein